MGAQVWGGPRVYVAPVSHGVTLTLVLQAWAWLLITSHSPGDFSRRQRPVPGEPAAQLTPPTPHLPGPSPRHCESVCHDSVCSSDSWDWPRESALEKQTYCVRTSLTRTGER